MTECEYVAVSECLVNDAQISQFVAWRVIAKKHNGKQGNKPDQMSIAGKAMKMDDIVKFISLLQARPDIANVQLISADESNNNNSSTAGVIDFTLEIQRSGVKK